MGEKKPRKPFDLKRAAERYEDIPMILAIMSLGLGTVSLLAWLVFHHKWLQMSTVLYSICGTWSAIVGLMIWEVKKIKRDSAALLEQTPNDDFASLCVLAEYGAKSEAQLALQKVQALLTTVTDETFAALHRGRRNWLGKKLVGNDRDFILALLPVFAHYGERGELKQVLALAEGKHLAATDLEIRERATETAKLITHRLTGGEPKKELLRSSDAPAQPTILLRPIRENVAETEQLLRSSHRDED